MSKAGAVVKRVVLGKPMSSGEMEHTLLPKSIALPVFSSDPLSSNAYATQEAMLVLALAGATAFKFILPVTLAVACLLWIVVTSYRQTVKAYPSGGGAYRVSRENLGLVPGLTAGSALLIDYTLTVAVSITAGVDAIISAVPDLEEYQVEVAIGFIVLVTLANLRGSKESGVLFAVPTYGFVVAIYMMIGTGIIKCLDECPVAETAGSGLQPETAVTFVLLLRAFAAGTTALTGVEAIADGVPAFRYPQSRNAANTLAIMATLSTTMFLGISFLADRTNVVFSEDLHAKTVLAQVADAVFGGGALFYFVQIMSASILILAANTAYQDFPRLSSILAADHLMPRQFMNRGDRLVFSNGIVILAIAASTLVWVFDSDLNRLIQLYLVGVFISFTLSQTGMVVRSLRVRPPGWRRTVPISGFGATITGTVLLVVIYTKFARGAWLVLVMIPILMYLMRGIHSHYESLRRQLGRPDRRPVDRRPGHQHVVIMAARVDAATARAVGYSRSMRAAEVSAVTFDRANLSPWKRLAPDIPLQYLETETSRTRTLKKFARAKRRGLTQDDFLTLVVPEVLESRSFLEIVRHPRLHRLKASMLTEPGVQILDVPVLQEDIKPDMDDSKEPARNYVCILVSAVHNATLQAIEYAETLQATDIRAVSFGLDPEATERLGNDWLEARIPHPLEIEDSPYRDIGRSLTNYIKQYEADGLNRVVTIVLPEFVVEKRHHQILHGQTALVVKRHLLFQEGVVAASVPYHVQEARTPKAASST
ncbi:MAG: APC family permease [Actinomycetota bacterium]